MLPPGTPSNVFEIQQKQKSWRRNTSRHLAVRLHTQRAHDTPSKPYLLPRHLADSDNIYAAQEGNLPTYHWQSGLLTFLFYLWQRGLRVFIYFYLYHRQPVQL